MDDASLDEFLDDGRNEDAPDEPDADDASAGPSGDGTAGPADDSAATTAGEESAASDSPAPATSTYEWSPEEAVCDACGAAVERRWRDGDRFVCPDCKEW